MKATRWSTTGYECPECGDWHDESETPIEEVAGWLCNACDGFHEGDPPDPERGLETLGQVFILEADVDGLLADYYRCPVDDGDYSGEPVPTSHYRVECGAVVEDQPEIGEAWQCEECETIYVDRDEAKECCT